MNVIKKNIYIKKNKKIKEREVLYLYYYGHGFSESDRCILGMNVNSRYQIHFLHLPVFYFIFTKSTPTHKKNVLIIYFKFYKKNVS